MSKSVDEQKELIINAVLDLNQKLKALKYLLREAQDPENKIVVEIYNELLWFIHGLIWENIVINIGWLYDKNSYLRDRKKNRSLFWYLEEIKKASTSSESKVDAQLSRIDNLQAEVEKVRKLRNKWVAHKDKKFFENSAELQKAKITIQDLEILVKTAEEIIQEHHPITDLTGSGVERIFAVIEILKHENPEFVSSMRMYGLLSYSINYTFEG
ncbi:MAG TPA: hypothetical protein VF571_06190 [Pyrinomonadaceae bacterium]|jgi:hypothetical protein